MSPLDLTSPDPSQGEDPARHVTDRSVGFPTVQPAASNGQPESGQGRSASSHGRRLPCQVCGRLLTTRNDGLTKPHGRYGDCKGVGYRHDQWPVGQRLRHYAGSVWEVVAAEPYKGRSYDWMVEYTMRCLADPFKTGGREVGSTDTFHGEYMHRHGWTPVEVAA